MLIQQYIEEFNALVGKESFKLSSDNSSFVRSKLEIVNSIYNGDSSDLTNIPVICVKSYVQNIKKILNLSLAYSIDINVLCLILDFLVKALFHGESTFKLEILQELSYPILISLIVVKDFVENVKSLIDLLRVTKEVIKATDHDIDEHNITLLIHGFNNYDALVNNDNVTQLIAEILVNLCLKQPSARARIVRAIKATKFMSRLAEMKDELISFKYYILVEENNPHQTDVLYFFKMSIKIILKGIDQLNCEPIESSLDVIDDFKSHKNIPCISLYEDENFMSMVETFVSEFAKIFHKSDPPHRKYSKKAFKLLTKMVEFDELIAQNLEDFVNEVCSHDSKSAEVLDFLSSVLYARSKSTAITQTKEFIDELLNKFDTKVDDFRQRFAFMNLIRAYKLGEFKELDMEKIYSYFKTTLKYYQDAVITKFSDDDFFYFAHVVNALQAFQSDIRMKPLMNEFIDWPLSKMIIARCFLSNNADIITICMELSKIEGFKSKPIAEYISRSSIKRYLPASNTEINRASETMISKAIKDKLCEHLEETLDRVNQTLDNNDISNLRIFDVIELYSRKIELLQNWNDSLTSKLDESVSINCELNKMMKTNADILRQQDTNHWTLEFQNRTLENEIQTVKMENLSCKQSVQLFTEKFQKELESRNNAEKHYKKEIEELKKQNEKIIKEHASAHEKIIQEKDKKIRELETSLTEAEQMKLTIMSLMQTKSFKK